MDSVSNIIANGIPSIYHYLHPFAQESWRQSDIIRPSLYRGKNQGDLDSKNVGSNAVEASFTDRIIYCDQENPQDASAVFENKSLFSSSPHGISPTRNYPHSLSDAPTSSKYHHTTLATDTNVNISDVNCSTSLDKNRPDDDSDSKGNGNHAEVYKRPYYNIINERDFDEKFKSGKDIVKQIERESGRCLERRRTSSTSEDASKVSSNDNYRKGPKSSRVICRAKQRMELFDRRPTSISNAFQDHDTDRRDSNIDRTTMIEMDSPTSGSPAHDQMDTNSVRFRVHGGETKQLLSQSKSGVTVTLLNSSLWRAFHDIGTEMIINRGGRRMFPYLALSVQGLEPDSQYDVTVQIVPASNRRFKYINSKWIPVGLADIEAIQMPYTHQDSPNSGSFWNSSKINFSKIKLTNNLDSGIHNILLHSMHKYKIVTTFTPLTEETTSQVGVAKQSMTFTFPETDFTAVTAYQNETVTQMKIHNNPFAKAFRDANFSSVRRNLAMRKRKHASRHLEQPKAPRVTIPSSRDERSNTCEPIASMHCGDSVTSLYGSESMTSLHSGHPLTSLYTSHLPAYTTNAHTLRSTGSGFQPSHLLGLGNLAYCLPWGGLPIIPPNLCTSLLPVPPSRFPGSYVSNGGIVTPDTFSDMRTAAGITPSALSFHHPFYPRATDIIDNSQSPIDDSK